jgi:hypothetical protein
MNAAISLMHSELFRGGGFYRKSILELLVQAFGSERFTYQQANARIDGFDRSACRDFLSAGLIRYETRKYPFFYRVHQPLLTHRLTRKELIERWRKQTGAILSVVSVMNKQTYETDTGGKTHEE